MFLGLDWGWIGVITVVFGVITGVYTNLSSAQTTIVDISEHSWTRTVLDDYESGQNLNVFLSCYSLRLTNIAVIANPSSSTSTS